MVKYIVHEMFSSLLQRRTMKLVRMKVNLAAKKCQEKCMPLPLTVPQLLDRAE
jgi:hypothetical protein